jgi:hypothetical protein
MDPKDPELSERAIAAMNAKYPITTKMSVYILDSAVTQNELNYCENTIKTYAPEYTYEMLDEDHAITEYEGTDEAPALFRMALEYTLDDDGVTVSSCSKRYRIRRNYLQALVSVYTAIHGLH